MAITVPNVVKANATPSGATSISTSGASTTTGSTFLIVAICEAGVTPTFSDNKGNSYAARIGSIQTQGGAMAVEARYVQNGAGGAGHTATVTFSSAAYGVVFFIEIAGAAALSYDSAATAQAASTSGQPFAVTSGTPAQANNAVISYCASDAGGTLNYTAAGFTVTQEPDGNTYWTGAVGYKLITAAAAETASWAVGASGALRTIAVFKEATGGGGVTCTLAVTDAADTVASAAALSISATLARTDGADTVSGTAAAAIVAAHGVTDGADVLAGAAVAQIVASLSATDTGDALTAAAVLPVAAALAASDVADALASAAVVGVAASASVTDSPDSLASAVFVGSAPVTVDLAVTDAADVAASAAVVRVVASVAVTDDADTFASAAVARLLASLEVTDGADLLSAQALMSGYVPPVLGSLIGRTRQAFGIRSSVQTATRKNEQSSKR